MIDLRRLRGLLVAFVPVLIALVGLNRGLNLAWPPDRVASFQSTVTPGSQDLAGRRLVQHLAECKGQLKPPGGTLGIIVGASTGYTATDTETLRQWYGLSSSWLGYYITGGNASDLDRLVSLLRKYGVAPDYLVLSLNPFMLADSDRGAEGGYFPNVMNFNRESRDLLLRAKMAVLGAFGQDLPEVVFAPDPLATRDPRNAIVDWGRAGVFDIIARNVVIFRSLGFYDPKCYPTGGVNYRALTDLVRRERRLGTKVVAVLMPEASVFRDTFPPEAKRAVIAALESCEGADRPLILDFSRSLEDSLFWDFHHVSPYKEGPHLYAAELARRIKLAESARTDVVQVITPLDIVQGLKAAQAPTAGPAIR